MENQFNVLTYTCPVALEFGVKVLDLNPERSKARATLLMIRACQVLTELFPDLPRTLASPSKDDLMLLRGRVFKNQWEHEFVSLVIKMHDEIYSFDSDKSSLSRFGFLACQFKQLLEIFNPKLKMDFPLFLTAPN